MTSLRPPPWVIDVAFVVLAALDAWLASYPTETEDVVMAVIACAALFFRRRWPLAVFVLTLPAAALTDLVVAPAVALYTVAKLSADRRVPVVCAIVTAVSAAITFPFMEQVSRADAVVSGAYVVAWAAAPVLFGQLVRARDELAQRLVEIEQARDHERRLHAQAVLARERAQIGREMHDVVSHQVSLIAVRAGALMVAAPDTDTKEAARTIRGLSVTTLEELRHLVTLLRASGGRSTELTPQPTLADLRALVDSSGIAVELDGSLPADITGAAQRAIYRTVQEALTNVRKHAPGATADIRLWSTAQTLGVSITNTPSTRSALPLPGSGHGLVGLAERAELLQGQLLSGRTADGGFRVELRVPRS
ncbi:two-component sensor histidine kinase [Nocardia sp. ET3-3]|uniref:histidine kinase n=1 Tax=Nocardia terrae TaxID=2675851 RepID=A0A7K1UUQ7_9NOCA|nr:histidine kinase [Nocardia terrae]MVU78084.1 two-component sensor histidine kinase [Nocardia terrae]